MQSKDMWLQNVIGIVIRNVIIDTKTKPEYNIVNVLNKFSPRQELVAHPDEHQNRTKKNKNNGIYVNAIMKRLVVCIWGDKEPNRSATKVQWEENIKYRRMSRYYL